MDIKISLITVSFNSENTIERCIQSVSGQTYKNIEYIIVDGGSTDKTPEIIHNKKNSIHRIVSEPDKGIYDAMNKGIALATGDIIGMLNSDDFFTDNNVLTAVAEAFVDKNVQLLYGDLDYVDVAGKTLRKWRSGQYREGHFNWGWMPAHPTFYCRKVLFDEYGTYRLDLGTSADYELMLRFIHKHRLDPFYLKKVMVTMQSGGASNKNLVSRLKSLKNDMKAMRLNCIPLPILTLFAKPLRKIRQYF